MDQGPAARRVADRGIGSIQFALASGLALILFVALANLVVIQYGTGVLRSALEQGARSGSVAGETACETTAHAVVADLLGGRMSDALVIDCSPSGGTLLARGVATFPSWTPLMPDFRVELVARAVGEP